MSLKYDFVKNDSKRAQNELKKYDLCGERFKRGVKGARHEKMAVKLRFVVKD